jgi:hypothetical protein
MGISRRGRVATAVRGVGPVHTVDNCVHMHLCRCKGYRRRWPVSVARRICPIALNSSTSAQSSSPLSISVESYTPATTTPLLPSPRCDRLHSSEQPPMPPRVHCQHQPPAPRVRLDLAPSRPRANLPCPKPSPRLCATMPRHRRRPVPSGPPSLKNPQVFQDPASRQWGPQPRLR